MRESGKTRSGRFVLALATTIGFALAPYIARAQPAVRPNEIRIVVNGVRNQKGSVICSLWASAKSDVFTTAGTASYKMSVPIRGSQGVCEFKALAAGAYAATVFHDENGNGKFDRRFGYPLEGYGFSNNVNPTLRAPSFDQCKIQYAGKGVLTVPINLIYR
ncbi:MAG TPA: DUF2141 domain-containing protein [Candidatus Binataceae bacterium]|nr:DUF2141 domain-containing protein [Candidatus Binataceae bacterium]